MATTTATIRIEDSTKVHIAAADRAGKTAHAKKARTSRSRTVQIIDGCVPERVGQIMHAIQVLNASPTMGRPVRNGQMRGVSFDALDRLCAALQCQPTQLLKWQLTPED